MYNLKLSFICLKLILNSISNAGAIKLEVTADDLLEMVRKVVEDTASLIYSKLKEERNPEFMTRKDAMKLLNVKTALTMIRWEEKGYLNPHRISGRVYYRQNEVTDAFEKFSRSTDY